MTAPRPGESAGYLEHPAKSVAALERGYFARFSVWGFDVSMETDEGLDETAVRPYVFERPPRTSDVLFVRANLTTGRGAQVAGAASFRFEKGRPTDVALCLLEPYCALQQDGDGPIATTDSYWAFVKTIHPAVDALFPLKYEATFEVGGKTFALAATVTLEP